MIRYKTRPGVVLANILGENVLVSARANLALCPYVSEINETSAFLWQKLVDGASEDELLDAVCGEYEIDDPEAARQAIRGFIAQMLELNYLLPIEGEPNEEQE